VPPSGCTPVTEILPNKRNLHESEEQEFVKKKLIRRTLNAEISGMRQNDETRHEVKNASSYSIRNREWKSSDL
jgi:hypothetical protein